ncbi:MAG: diaminopimelate decarboxylase [Kiritimatiellia bacterium]
MVNIKVTDLPASAILRAARKYPTPFFLYSENKIRANCRAFKGAFRAFFPSFEPLYAVKANNNPRLLKVIFEEGFGADASSEAEAWIVRKLGARGMYTGNYTSAAEFRFVVRTGAFLLNLDDITMLDTIRKIGVPEFLSFRVNPGFGRGSMKSLRLAGPDAKYGVPAEKIVEAYRRARALGVKRFGIHAMTGSNVMDENYFEAVAEVLLEIAGKIRDKLGIAMERLNIGGGFGVPYRPEERSLDLARAAAGVRRAFDRQCARFNMPEPVLMAEPGRFIMADTAWLVGRVNVVKESYKKFAGIDAGMNDLPRPAVYDAYHHVTVVGRSLSGRKEKVNIVGRLCENNDQFAKDRLLPPVRVGDLIAIHNAGAHAYAMGHNYNTRLRSAEYLLAADGKISKIRRAESIADIFGTVV